MCVKRDIILFFRREFLLLKNLKLIFWVPLIIIDAAMPIFAWYAYENYDLFRADYDVKTVIMIFIPLFSAWWSIFTAREFLESRGNELLFLKQKMIFAEMLLPFLLYIGNYSLVLSLLSVWRDDTGKLITEMLTVSLLVFGMSYFTAFLSKSITVPLLACTLYVLINMTIPTEKPCPFMYYSASNYPIEEVYIVFIPILCTGIFLVLAGLILNYRFKKYV